MNAELPLLDSDYSLSDDQVQTYRRDGHVLLRGVASSDEVAAYRKVLGDVVASHNKQRLPMEQRDTYHKAFIQVGNLWELDERVKRFVMARRFAKIAAELMGVPAVRLYHDQALYKEPGGGYTPWHQDMYYWPLDTDKTVTLWMPLVDVPAAMGPMTFASGTHRDGSLLNEGIGDNSEAFFDQLVKERNHQLVSYELSAGDATFHAGWTLHRAGGNDSDRMREVMTVIYMADGTRVLEPDNPNRPADLARWLPGCQPGDVAASPLNPILYSAEAA